TMFSVMYTGMNLFPLCTATVCPTNSGEIVDARDHVLMTFFSFLEFMLSILKRSLSLMNGPFFTLRGIAWSPAYFVALPRRRPRTMYLVDSFFFLRVFLPSGLPHGDTGGRPPDERPSPPPSGRSPGFLATPRTLGRLP